MVNISGANAATINGVVYPLVKSTYSTSTVARTTQVGQDGIHGYAEIPTPGHISLTLRDSQGQSMAYFNSLTDATVQILLKNGKTVLGQGCWTVDSQELDTAEGTFEVKFESASVTDF